MDHWFQIEESEVASALGTDLERGLSWGEAKRRLREKGPNELKEPPPQNPLLVFLRQFEEPLVVLLLVAAVISGVIGEWKDFSVIVAILLLNGAIGFVQEYRAEKAMRALKKMLIPKAKVVREGKVAEVVARDLVEGDLILLEAGMQVPADLRVVESISLRVNEAPLTGESAPVGKTDEPIKEPEVPLAERKNMAYMGTTVVYGRGKGIVVATGMRTEIGKVASLLRGQPEERTPLQHRLAQAGKWLAGAAVAVCALIFLLGLLRGERLSEMFLFSVSLAVAAVPEGLPAVITVALALGARELARRKALVRRLQAVETLGSVTVICSDKTGTITEGEMAPCMVYASGREVRLDGGREALKKEGFSLLLRGMALCNDAYISKDGSRGIGDPTEVALLRAALLAGLKKEELEARYPRVSELPFDSQRKMMTTLHGFDGGFVSFTKGAPDEVLSRCSFSLEEGEEVPLTEGRREGLRRRLEEWASVGIRVLACAMKRWDGRPGRLSEEGLTFLGFVGMSDPPRPEVKGAVAKCKEAGIIPVMVTGDHRATAVSVAKEVGMMPEGVEVLTGRELERLSMEELSKRVERVRVYARVAPEQKVKIVEAWERKGHIVAMTGDGVNDGPALGEADVGVAMGKRGTDVAKEAADIVLLDDNFATIVSAVEGGRSIYDNIRKFVRFLLATNVGEIATILGSMLLRLPLPLAPVHILWINLVTDGPPAMALGFEPSEPGVMRRPPRPPKESIFARGLGWFVLWAGLFMAVGTLLMFLYGLKTGGLKEAKSLAFFTLASFQLFNVLAARSESHHLWRLGAFSNPHLLGAVALSFGLLLLALYLPGAAGFFKTTPLPLEKLLLALAVSSSIFFAAELEKALKAKWGALSHSVT